MFVKPKYSNPNDYLREVQNDLFIPFLTVHDEIDYMCNRFLLKPIMFKAGKITHQKPIVNKLRYPYINFLLDIEYDEFGAWTASKSLDLYQTPTYENEHKYYKLWQDSLNTSKDNSPDNSEVVPSVKQVKVDIIEVRIRLRDVMSYLETKRPEEAFKYISEQEDGNNIVTMYHKEDNFSYGRPILLSKDLIALVDKNKQEN